MDKEQIRRQKIAERNALDADLRVEWSAAMVDTLTQSFEYHQARVVHVFVSFGSEPATGVLMNRAWSDGKSVVVPVVDAGSPELRHALVQPSDEFEVGPYGILQPSTPHLITFDELNTSTSVILVPLVAFNERLFRIGYGKGYYDRFLHGRKSFAFGYAFSCAFSEEFVPDAHDEQLDAIITEQGIVRRRRSSENFTTISLN